MDHGERVETAESWVVGRVRREGRGEATGEEGEERGRA